MYKIYGLTSQKDENIIKYVGLTSKSLEHRLKQHIYTSTKKNKNRYTKKEAWIKNRIDSGYQIEIIELESDLTKEQAMDLEIAWIAYYGLENLTNSTSGGDGVPEHIYSYEEKLNWYNAIEVYMYDLKGNFLNHYKTITDCSKKLNISHSSIFYCISGKNLTAHNFFFVSKKEDIDNKIKLYNERNNKYELYDLYGNLVDISNSITNLCKKYHFSGYISEFSKRLNNGVIQKTIHYKYFIKFPNFNLNVMLTSLQRYKIVNIKTKEIKTFILINDISKFLGCSKSSIIDCLSHYKKSIHGWMIYHINDEVEEYSKKSARKIIELDHFGNTLKIFNTIKEASDYYSIDDSCISKVCRGKRKHVKKHIFKYIDDIV